MKLTQAALLATASLLAAACPKPALGPVPDRSQRLELAVTPGALDVDDLVDAIACLYGSNGRQAELCEQQGTRDAVPSECERDATTAAERARPVLETLDTLRLTTYVEALAGFDDAFGDLHATRHVRDARRDVRCETWGSTATGPRKCLGIPLDRVWLVLEAPPGASTSVDKVVVFLSQARVCGDDANLRRRRP